MSDCIRGRITNPAINNLVRQFRGQLAPALQANLQRLRAKVEQALNGEDNVTVYIYIADALPEPIRFQMGKGENEFVIDIEENSIEYAWTKRTLWKKTKQFISEVAFNIAEGLKFVLQSALPIGGAAMKAIGFS